MFFVPLIRHTDTDARLKIHTDTDTRVMMIPIQIQFKNPYW